MSDVATIVLPLATAGIAGAAAIGGALLGGRKEKTQWLRMQRMQAFAAYLAATDTLARCPTPGLVDLRSDDYAESVAAVQRIQTTITLLLPYRHRLHLAADELTLRAATLRSAVDDEDKAEAAESYRAGRETFVDLAHLMLI